MVSLTLLLVPSQQNTYALLLVSLIMGILHGATPDEHTWPITFSYSVGSYSTRGGAKAGVVFSLGFTVQRIMLTTLGFLGLAWFYKEFNLEGPVYFAVGVVMFIAGSYVLHGKYIHIPIDTLFKGGIHHTARAERLPLHESRMNPVSYRMAFVHGLVAGFGFGAYATVITFSIAPQMPSIFYAPLPGLFFGLGTMSMQAIIGGVFGSLARAKKLKEEDICFIGRYTAGKTLYYGGILFSLVGILVSFLPSVSDLSLGINFILTRVNLDFGTALVLLVVGIVGLGNMYSALRTVKKINSSEYCS